MKFNLIKMLGTIVLICGFCVQAYGADVAKIGTINFQRILDVSTAGKEAHGQLNKQAQQMQADMESKGAEIQESKKQYEREALVMNEQMKRVKEQEIGKKIEAFRNLQARYTKISRELQFKLIGKIRNDIDGIVKEIGKKEGYLLILEQKEAGIIYMPSKLDISDKVIKLFNTRHEKAKKSAEKKE